jgi:hypothetical protein
LEEPEPRACGRAGSKSLRQAYTGASSGIERVSVASPGSRGWDLEAGTCAAATTAGRELSQITSSPCVVKACTPLRIEFL